MRTTDQPLPNRSLTSLGPLLLLPSRPPPPPLSGPRTPTSSSPPTTLAHLYAHVQAKSSNVTGTSMWRPQARPPLAHARSVNIPGGLPAELHAHYSMIAVVVLTALFFTVTLFATGLLLAFCKKTNTVFSLQQQQKADPDSNYELDDLDNKTHAPAGGEEGQASGADPGSATTSTSSSFTSSTAARGHHRRSHTFSDFTSSEPPPPPQQLSDSARCLAGSADTRGSFATVARKTRRTGESRQGVVVVESKPTNSSVKRSVTVAAIHHHHADDNPPAATNASSDDCCAVRIHVEDFDAKSDASDHAFDHLYLKLREEEEGEGEGKEYEESDVDDDHHNDQTRALLKS